MTTPFKLCILFGDKPDIRPPAEIGSGWDVTEVPVALQVRPFESDANWAAKKAEIASWNLPPARIASHFLQFWGLKAVGPDVDWEQLEFWTKRAFRRLSELGVEVVGIYGGFFAVPEGFSRDEATEQALRFCHLLADHAEQYGMTVALEPLSDLTTLWPRYLEGIEFAKQVNRPSVKVMADLNYFIKLDQPLEHIAIEPEYCTHVHIAESGAQPGAGDRTDLYRRLFRILRDIGYQGAVSCACAWVSTDDGPLRFGVETDKTLAYLQNLRAEVYAE
ncbi:MAG: sugar phosphate isomerase/epimerase family protein [Caldilineaceae bacterium]|nr:TIM barrel protein [Caldilineaceae bacterium]